MSWSATRQLLYGTMFLLALLIIVGLPVYFIFFNKTPTCFDGKMNQNELGIDCGGICQKACVQEVIAEPIIMWSRSFPVSGSLYNLVAYVQNPNVNYIAKPVQYSFQVYDKDNVLLALKEGYTDVPPVKTFPIFIQSVDVGARVPAKVLFKFNERLDWNKYQSTRPEVAISEPQVIRATSTPRIDAKVLNKTLNRFENIEVVAIVYGLNDNAMAVSRTFVPVLTSMGTVPVVFTWPNPFPEEITKIEIIPKLEF